MMRRIATGLMRQASVCWFGLAVCFMASPPVYAKSDDCSAKMISSMVAKGQSMAMPLPSEDWHTVQLPDNLNSRGENYSGGLWYRIRFRWHCQAPQAVAISLSHISMAGAVYLNNTLLWQDKHLTEPLSRSWNMPRYWIIPYQALNNVDNELQVYVVAIDGQSPGIGDIYIDVPEKVVAHHNNLWWKNRGVLFIHIAISLTLAIIAFFIWVMQRQETIFGWFAASNLFWSLFLSNALTVEPYPFSDSLSLARFNIGALSLYVLTFISYNLRYIGAKFPRLELGCVILLMASQVILWATPNSWFNATLSTVFLLCVSLLVASLLIIPIIALRKICLDNVALAMVLIFYLLIMFHDMVAVLQNSNPTLWFGFTLPITIFFFSLLLAWRLSRNIRAIQRFNTELEYQINTVSQQLRSSLKNEHQLAITNMRLQERLKLSYDLHDGLGSSLVRAITTIEQADTNIPKQRVLSLLKLLRDDLRQIIDSGSILAAKAPETPQIWLAPLRHRFMTIFDELDIDTSWELPELWQHTPQPIQCMTLARVLEESLTNVIKHSKATKVTVVLTYPSMQQLKLLIQDNGLGFNVEAVKAAGFNVGTRSMQARVERLGGKFTITSIPGKTDLTLIIPITCTGLGQ